MFRASWCCTHMQRRRLGHSIHVPKKKYAKQPHNEQLLTSTTSTTEQVKRALWLFTHLASNAMQKHEDILDSVKWCTQGPLLGDDKLRTMWLTVRSHKETLAKAYITSVSSWCDILFIHHVMWETNYNITLPSDLLSRHGITMSCVSPFTSPIGCSHASMPRWVLQVISRKLMKQRELKTEQRYRHNPPSGPASKMSLILDSKLHTGNK